jgi:hypothetical protein
MSLALPDGLLEIVIRFASSIPDLPLQISDPQHITVLSLKVLIRKHLPDPSNKCRLNLIFAGKLLHNNDTLTIALNLRNRRRIPPPPSIKGKEPAQPPGLPPLYVQCSLGDASSSADLESEVSTAAASEYALRNELHHPAFPTSPENQRDTSRPTQSGFDANPPRQLGFDRLLGTDWTTEDVATLRASFLSHLAYSHTPATMPTGDALRILEERWLENTAPEGTNASILLDEGTGGVVHLDDDEAGALDDGLWGSMLGFVWPWAAWWGHREEGVWTERRQQMLLMGLAANALFGFMRMITGSEDSF